MPIPFIEALNADADQPDLAVILTADRPRPPLASPDAEPNGGPATVYGARAYAAFTEFYTAHTASSTTAERDQATP